MSYYILDFDKDTSIFDINNIIIDNKIDYDESYKFFIYYNDNIPKELYIKLPKIRLTHNWTNIKYNQLKIRLTPNYNKIIEFIDFINNLENLIINHKSFNKKKLKLEHNSLITKEKNINYFKTYYQEDKTKIISNIKDKKIKITDFKINAEIQMVIKLSYIWQKNNKFGLSCQLYQIKYFAPPDDIDIDFFDEPNKIIKSDININKPDIKIDQPKKPIFSVDPLLLQSVKLKSIKKDT